jgi:DNA-binding PadR family transcriptional regulator
MNGKDCGQGFNWSFGDRPFDASKVFAAMFGGPGGSRGRSRGGPFGGGSRVFDQGDLKFVILRLLDEKPRHGYDIIKEIEERFGGMYSPSPGTVYPTLTMLEDLGYARAKPEESGKKIYEITDEGRAYLVENQPLIDDIFSRIAEFAQSIFGEPMMDVHRGMKDLGRAIYVSQNKQRTPEQIRKIKEILDRAAKEVEAI